MSDESSRLRLRPKLAGDSPATPPVAPSAPPPATTASVPPPRSVAPTAPPLTPVLNPPAAVVASPTTAPAPPDFAIRAQKVQRAALIVLALGVVIFAGVASIAFPRIRALEKTFLADQAPASEETTEAAPPPAKPPAASTAQVSAPASPSATAASPLRTDATSATLAPTAPAVPAVPASETPGGPSVAFRVWVQDIKIAGVRTGENPRILLGRSSFNVGDVVHPELGIIFDGYDPARRMLRFKDATGATIERRHP